MSFENKWQCIDNIRIYFSESDENGIAFNPQSGETHQINLLALDLIGFLKKPASFNQVKNYISALYQVQESEVFEQLCALIDQFEELGLIYSSQE